MGPHKYQMSYGKDASNLMQAKLCICHQQYFVEYFPPFCAAWTLLYSIEVMVLALTMIKTLVAGKSSVSPFQHYNSYFRLSVY